MMTIAEHPTPKLWRIRAILTNDDHKSDLAATLERAFPRKGFSHQVQYKCVFESELTRWMLGRHGKMSWTHKK